MGIGRRMDSSKKDTLINIEFAKEFAIIDFRISNGTICSVASARQIQSINAGPKEVFRSSRPNSLGLSRNPGIFFLNPLSLWFHVFAGISAPSPIHRKTIVNEGMARGIKNIYLPQECKKLCQ